MSSITIDPDNREEIEQILCGVLINIGKISRDAMKAHPAYADRISDVAKAALLKCAEIAEPFYGDAT